MAARTDGENVPVFGQFHQKCGDTVVLSEGRRVASTLVRSRSTFDAMKAMLIDPLPIAFSNNLIPKGVQFCVKVLHQESKGKDNVSPLIQTHCSLQCVPCLDSAHSTAVNSQLVSCRLV